MNTTDISRSIRSDSRTLRKTSRRIGGYLPVDPSRFCQTRKKYHPEPERLTQLNRPDTNFGTDDARLVVAREHGFVDWPAFLRHIADLKEPGSPVAQV